MRFKRYLVTAALPYANGPIHIGHLAGCYLPADIYVRYLRQKKEDVIFICGSDEHGVPITIKAKKEGITPQQVVDKYHKLMGDAFRDFGISFDIYSRTSSEIHHKTASEFFKTLYNKKVFEEIITDQYFDEKANQFLADRYIMGTCPKCGNPDAYGDQCEKCGSALSPNELINPRSTLSGEKPVLRKTKNWFLPLDKIQPKIEAYIESHKPGGFIDPDNPKEEWKPNVYGQCKSWLNQGLQPRAMTRDLDWGVKVPVEGAEGKVLYVWFDAPIGYISATKEYFEQKGESEKWELYWKDKETRLIHFIGKDNIVFHCIIFPAMLMEHGDYILAENVPANEFLNLEGDKISTSRNWAVWLHEYLQEFPNKQDELRYVLTSIAPETKDSDFSWKDYQARVNNELVAILGNFVNRVMVLTHKYYGGIIPQGKLDPALTDKYVLTHSIVKTAIEKYQFREALFEAMNLARAGNLYLQENEPWKLINTDKEKTADVIYNSLVLTLHLAYLLEPFMPFTSKRILKMLNIQEPLLLQNLNFTLSPGHQLGEAILLFSKIEDDVIQKQIDKLQASKKVESTTTNPENTALKTDITYDDFIKMDIRIGTILEAERVPKTDKLLKLLIDTGIDKRTVVSGIAEYYKPEEIIGQKVSVLANLAPRKIKGIESKGMILMAENADGTLSFVAPTRSDINNGSIVR